MLVHRNNVVYLLDFRTKLETEPMKHWYYMTKSTSQEAGDGYLQNQRELYIYIYVALTALSTAQFATQNPRAKQGWECDNQED